MKRLLLLISIAILLASCTVVQKAVRPCDLNPTFPCDNPEISGAMGRGWR